MARHKVQPALRPQLTARESQIAAAVASGLNNRQIAGRLGISEKTVRNQLTVLFQKMDVQGRLQLAIRVLGQRNETEIDKKNRAE